MNEIYAYVHVTMSNGDKHKFTMKNDEELGYTLNAVQGAVFDEKMIEVHVEPIAEESKFKSRAFNLVAGTLKKQTQTSKTIRGDP